MLWYCKRLHVTLNLLKKEINGRKWTSLFLSYKNSYYSYHQGRTKALCELRTFVPRVLIPAILQSLNFILSSSCLVCNISSFLTKKLICHHFFVWLSSLKKAIVKARISMLIISFPNTTLCRRLVHGFLQTLEF